MAGAGRLVSDLIPRALAGFLLVLALTFAPGLPAQGSATAPASSSLAVEERARVEALIGTLEDEAQRARLIGQLRLLLKVQPEQAAQDGIGDVGRIFVGALAGDLALRIDRVLSGLRLLALLDRSSEWIRRVATDRAEHGRLLGFLGTLAAALAAGFAAEWIMRQPLRMAMRRVTHGSAGGAARRAVRVLAGAVLIGIPLAVFALAASVAGSALSARPLEGIAATMIVAGHVLTLFVTRLATLALAPGEEHPRLIDIGQDSAAYLHVWIGRFARIGIYGTSLLASLQPLGMPLLMQEFLLRVLGLVLVVLAIVVILQSRESVAAWIGVERRDAVGAGRMVQALRGYAASLWHVLAIAYLALGYGVWAVGVDGGGRYLLRATLVTVAVLCAAKLASTLLRRGLDRLFRISSDLAARTPLLEARANRYLPILRIVADMAILVVACSAVLEAWGLNGFSWITTDIGRALIGKLLSLAIVVAIAMLAWEVASALIERRLRQLDLAQEGGPRSQRLRTFLPLLRNVAFVVIAGVAVLTILSEIGVNVAPLLAGAGVVGVAIGFGSQTLVKDVITGLFILFEDTVNVGDVVDLDGGHSGTVESLSIRSIRLRDITGAQHTVPFSQVSTIKNMTKDFGFYVFDLSVAYGTEVPRVVEVLREVDMAARAEPAIAADLLEPLEVLGLDRFGDFALVVRARVKTRPGRQWRVGRIYNERIKVAFDRAGIEIPYPHRVEIQKRAETARLPEPPEPPEGKPAQG
jgi:small conductance mechanosensitive channel